MMKLSDLFDFSYYERHPEWQTKEEWNRIQIYILFLSPVEEREMVSLEERSLELFGHEKFLLDSDLFPDGKGFLTRIGISEEQLENGELRGAFCILDETRERNERYSNEYSLLKIYHSFILPLNYWKRINSIMNLN